MDQETAPVKPNKKEEILLEWTAPSRLFKRRDKEYFTNIAAIVFLLSIILVFAREFVLIAAVLAIVFLVYALSTVPPEDIKHKITTLGVETSGRFYRWEELIEFWFESQWGQKILVLRPYLAARTMLILGNQSDDIVREIVARFIPYRENPERTWVENASRWLSQKIPLEKTS